MSFKKKERIIHESFSYKKKTLGVKEQIDVLYVHLQQKKIDMYRTHNCGELKMENVVIRLRFLGFKSLNLGGDLY